MLSDIKKYLKETGMAPTRFGRNVCGDPRLVGDMERGREIKSPTLQNKIKNFLRDNS